MAFGQYKYSSRPKRLKLVKSSIYYCKTQPFSDSIHCLLEVVGP